MNESVWKDRFDAALKVPEGALTLRAKRDGYTYTLERWLHMQLGKMQTPGYTLPPKGERRGWHKEITERRMSKKGLTRPIFPPTFADF